TSNTCGLRVICCILTLFTHLTPIRSGFSASAHSRCQPCFLGALFAFLRACLEQNFRCCKKRSYSASSTRSALSRCARLLRALRVLRGENRVSRSHPQRHVAAGAPR